MTKGQAGRAFRRTFPKAAAPLRPTAIPGAACLQRPLARWILALALLSPAPAAAAARTEQPLHTPAGPYEAVTKSVVTLDAPLPADAAAAPAACQHLRYYRYRHVTGPDDPQEADAVFVSMPGIFGGAASLEQNGLQVVQAAAARGAHVEYWALDRRPNCIEDRAGIDAATRTGDPQTAIDYYFGGAAVDGRRFSGFPSSRRLRYLADIDLEQVLRDERTVIVDGIPNPAVRRAKVFCGGHSLGGILTGLLLAWDFDGDPSTGADAGHQLCAGTVALDSLVTADPIGLRAMPELTALLGPITSMGASGVRRAIDAGAISRIVDIGVIGPRTFTLLKGLGLFASRFPDDDVAPLLTQVPRDPGIEATLRFFHSQTATDARARAPRIRRQHLTGRAAIGAFLDDNSQPLGFAQASFGSFDRGPVAHKSFPLAGGAGHLLLGLRTPLMFPSDDATSYGWRNYDEALPDLRRNDGRPYTSPSSEVTDIADLERILHTGPLDFTEEFFSSQLTADVLFALAGSRSGPLAHIRYPDAPRALPRLTVLGGDSFARALLAAGLRDAPRDAVIVPGYNHLDVVTASPKQNDGRPEQVSARVAAFLLSRSEATLRTR